MTPITDRLRSHIEAGYKPLPRDGAPADDTLQSALDEISLWRGALSDLVDAVQRIRPISGKDSRALIAATDRAELALARQHHGRATAS
jgi:hypothetical protein